ncbi:sulfatase family protein [Microlunatus soli]|uniref:Arylsulfatase A n=1 Tax=Microlunatus soli TaxID=630515 RepID=A0A1H1QMY2_9ACTN|nr:sulfatase-like hydrolase/transferase [Microlunatus soli]SDS24765.1 Arylsulfatase A [Microlunatus soli]
MAGAGNDVARERAAADGSAMARSGRPNIILIVSDDHGYGDRGAVSEQAGVVTPALDRIAAEGMTCTDAYVTAPICSPSRAGIISGRYQQRWGGLWFDSAAFPPDDPADAPSLAEALQRQGYRTGYFGKVHYGKEQVGDRACPPHHGFDVTTYGLAGQSMGRLNYLRHSSAAQQQYGEAAQPMAVQPLLTGDEPLEYEGFLTEELGRRARDFIAAEEDQPYFCMIAFNAVHNFCWQLPDEELKRRGLPTYRDWDPDSGTSYGDWYDDAIVPNLPHGRDYYLAQLELMDAEIGNLLDQLDEAGQRENTLVVYLTDNGGSTCNYGDNAPLRGTKYTLWEGGIRVPFLMSWPERIAAGSTRSAVTSSLDLYPTLLAAAGATPEAYRQSDGIDLISDDAGHRDLHWDCGFQWAVRSGDWKLCEVDDGSPNVQHLASYEHAPMGEGLRLTNLAVDVAEQHDLSSQHPEIVEQLTALHRSWRTDVGLPAS